MFGTGAPEAIIILLVALLLFKPALLTFWLGYTMGQRRSGSGESGDEAKVAGAADEAPEENADE